MTTNTGQAAAPLTPLQVAVAESEPEKAPHVNLGGVDWYLIPKLTVAATVTLDTAQREGDFAKIINAAALLIKKDQREAFKHLLLEDEDAEVDLDTFLETLEKAIEGVVGRPTDTTSS